MTYVVFNIWFILHKYDKLCLKKDGNGVRSTVMIKYTRPFSLPLLMY